MNLKELRKKKGLSQKQAANALGISMRAYQNYEYGQREPNIEMINKLANFYGVTTDYLLDRPEAKPPDDPIDSFAANVSLQELEKILIKQYLDLTEPQRQLVLDFMRRAIDSEAARKKAVLEQKGLDIVP